MMYKAIQWTQSLIEERQNQVLRLRTQQVAYIRYGVLASHTTSNFFWRSQCKKYRMTRKVSSCESFLGHNSSLEALETCKWWQQLKKLECCTAKELASAVSKIRNWNVFFNNIQEVEYKHITRTQWSYIDDGKDPNNPLTFWFIVIKE